MGKISGGNDKQGFPMMQGVLSNGRVRLLFKDGMKTFRERRNGSRKRKPVRGCIVGSDICILNLVVMQKGEQDIEGLTDEASEHPRRLGPKRASKIRKLFGLTKEDDVRKYVIRRIVKEDGKKVKTKAPKIQRLTTDAKVAKKRYMKAKVIKGVQNSKQQAVEYHQRVHAYRMELKEKKAAEVAKKKAKAAKA